MAVAADSEDLLLRGDWLPVTATLPLVEAEAQVCADAVVAARQQRIAAGDDVWPLSTRVVRGALPELLSTLLPLITAYPDRTLMIPTRKAQGRTWTATLDNGWNGTESASIMFYGARGLRAVAVTESPNTYDPTTNLGYWGQRKIEVVVPDANQRDGFIPYSLGVRVTDSRRWEFIEPVTGTPFPDPTDYRARRIASKFTHNHLAQAAAWFGLRPFDEDFYAPDRWAILVEDPTPRDPTLRRWTLEQAQTHGRGVLWSHVENGRVVQL